MGHFQYSPVKRTVKSSPPQITLTSDVLQSQNPTNLRNPLPPVSARRLMILDLPLRAQMEGQKLRAWHTGIAITGQEGGSTSFYCYEYARFGSRPKSFGYCPGIIPGKGPKALRVDANTGKCCLLDDSIYVAKSLEWMGQEHIAYQSRSTDNC